MILEEGILGREVSFVVRPAEIIIGEKPPTNYGIVRGLYMTPQGLMIIVERIDGRDGQVVGVGSLITGPIGSFTFLTPQ